MKIRTKLLPGLKMEHNNVFELLQGGNSCIISPVFTLILDTSTEKGFVAVAKNETIVFEKLFSLKGAKGSSLLFAAIEEGFEALQISIKDFKVIALANGPGLFTGIRVSAAAGIAIAKGASLPIITFSSLSGFIPQEDGYFVSFIDAKIGMAHVMFREKKGKQIVDHSKKECLSEISLKEKLSHYKSIVSPFFGKWQFPQGTESFPNISFLAAEIEEKFCNKNFAKDLSLQY